MRKLDFFAALFLFLCSCSGGDASQTAAPPAPVRLAFVEQGDMTRNLEAVGNVRASASVAITPRVDGEIVAVNFREGQDVKAGESILEIDPRPYAAALAEKKANLAKSRARLDKALRDRARFGKLVRNDFISREAYEQSVADAAALAATVSADEAAARQAELDLSFCSVRAPISGRIGELKIDRGNIFKSASGEPVCSISAISPCYASFSVPEAYLPAILEYSRKGSLPVTAIPTGGTAETGELNLVDNSVDTKTGSIRLRAFFENTDRRLWPGQFVEIDLPLGVIENVLIVPTNAIQRGREESFVYVVGPDNRAEYRKITKLLEHDGKTAVRGNLRPGEKVVTEGQIRLAPGSPVQPLD